MIDEQIIKQYIIELLEKIGLGDDVISVEYFQGATSRFTISLREHANMLIGEYGGNLGAFEHILKKITRKRTEREDRFTIDVNEYRMRRFEELKQDVKMAARTVRMYRHDMQLRPMSPFERRVVHLLLAEYPDLTTESVGQDANRRVVIKPYP